MYRRKLTTRLATAGAAGALALGAIACEMDEGGDDLDPGQEAPEDDLGGEGDGLDNGADDGLDEGADDGLDDGADDGLDDDVEGDDEIGDDF